MDCGDDLGAAISPVCSPDGPDLLGLLAHCGRYMGLCNLENVSMIDEAIKSLLDGITERLSGAFGWLTGWLTFSFVDPFWHWFLLGLVVIAAATAIAWFFGGLSNFIRAAGGLVVMGVIAMLYAFRKGEEEARDFDKKKKRR